LYDALSRKVVTLSTREVAKTARPFRFCGYKFLTLRRPILTPLRFRAEMFHFADACPPADGERQEPSTRFDTIHMQRHGVEVGDIPPTTAQSSRRGRTIADQGVSILIENLELGNWGQRGS